MNNSDIVTLIKEVVPDAVDVQVSGADCSFTAIVISPSFEGMSPLKRQQQILARFSSQLASGELHALSVMTHTPEEWRAREQSNLTQLQT